MSAARAGVVARAQWAPALALAQRADGGGVSLVMSDAKVAAGPLLFVFEVMPRARCVPAALRVSILWGSGSDVVDEAVLGPVAVPSGSEVDSTAERLAWLRPDRPDADTTGAPECVFLFKHKLVFPRAGAPGERFVAEIANDGSAEIRLAPTALADPAFDVDQFCRTAAGAAAIEFPRDDLRAIDLRDCLRAFTRPAVLNEDNKWEYPACGRKVCAVQKMKIWIAPLILVIQLKSFASGAGECEKIETPVIFPDVLDMRPYVAGPGVREPCNYRLFAAGEHTRTLSFGRYTAHALVQQDGEAGIWYSFNDDFVSKSADARSPNAYLLFYQRAS
jgi:hypothetical protein